MATLLAANPSMMLTVENLSTGTDATSISTQAASLASALQAAGIASDRIRTQTATAQTQDVVQLRIHPEFTQFYLDVRAQMKNNN